MIQSFKHKGLRKLWINDDYGGIPGSHAPRILRILDVLEAATKRGDLALPGYRFHPLKGGRKGQYTVSVTGNWRITFEFDSANATNVNLENYR
jgi:proteic killer suppression protein